MEREGARRVRLYARHAARDHAQRRQDGRERLRVNAAAGIALQPLAFCPDHSGEKSPLPAASAFVRKGSMPLAQALAHMPTAAPVFFLSGPEGGLSPAEEALAAAHGFVPVTLGARVLRSETAALAALLLAVQL